MYSWPQYKRLVCAPANSCHNRILAISPTPSHQKQLPSNKRLHHGRALRYADLCASILGFGAWIDLICVSCRFLPDAIILGTGVTECVLSSLLSVEGKKVLHMDRNEYYGGDMASLNLSQLYHKFRPDDAQVPTDLGRDRDWAIDLIPKFILSSGELTNMLAHTDVTRYLEFKQVSASYVYHEGQIAKVPATEMEAIKSPLMGTMKKNRVRNFLLFVQGWRDDDPATHSGVDLDAMTMQEVYSKFGLESASDFIGHSIALYLDDSYLERPARETYDRIVLYTTSIARYGKSPYIYPLHGLGELPQGFARLSAIYGGTYMLSKPIEEIVLHDDGKFKGVKSEGETVTADLVIGDPSYFRGTTVGKQKVKSTGQVVRAICLLKHPIPNTDEANSVQLIIPQKALGRQNDMYIALVSANHKVAPEGLYIASVTTIVETDKPEEELKPGLDLLGPIYDKFVSIDPQEEPLDSGSEDNIFITRSYDATSHVETVVRDVQAVWARATNGEPLVLKHAPTGDDGVQSQE